jgi:hypothetical protein
MTNRARELRSNQTRAELRLWRELRNGQMLGFKFRRQHQFETTSLTFTVPRRSWSLNAMDQFTMATILGNTINRVTPT